MTSVQHPTAVSTVYRRAPHALCRAFGSEVHLVARVGDDVRILRGPAVDVWQLLDGQRALDEVADLLARAYGQPRERIADDLDRFVAQLARLGLITEVAVS